MKRKFLAFMLIVTMALPLFFVVAQASQFPTGTRIGDVLNTDIRVYLNGYAIRSFNINGHTYITAEDLSDFGHVVSWSSAARRLDIGNFVQGLMGNPPHVAPNTAPISSIAFGYFATDIVTYINGTRVDSYNIAGQTAIRLTDLTALTQGVQNWLAGTREVLAATYGLGARRAPERVAFFHEFNHFAQNGTTLGVGTSLGITHPNTLMNDNWTSNATRDFNIEGQWRYLHFDLIRLDRAGTGTGTVWIIGDGVTLATLETEQHQRPQSHSVNVSGVTVLRMQISGNASGLTNVMIERN